MVDLDKIAEQCHARFSERAELRCADLDTATAVAILAHFSGQYGSDMVLYGGQTATPLFWGFKQMRKLTNDFDFVVTEQMLPRVIESEGLQYHSAYHVFFGYCRDIICCFTGGSIHGWEIPEEFFSYSSILRVKGIAVTVCSREFTAALKFRRALDKGTPLFGKDAIDIINIVTAPLFRDDLPPLNRERTAATILKHAGPGAIPLFEAVFHHLHHLPADKQAAAGEEVFRLYAALRERAA